MAGSKSRRGASKRVARARPSAGCFCCFLVLAALGLCEKKKVGWLQVQVARYLGHVPGTGEVPPAPAQLCRARRFAARRAQSQSRTLNQVLRGRVPRLPRWARVCILAPSRVDFFFVILFFFCDFFFPSATCDWPDLCSFLSLQAFHPTKPLPAEGPVRT